MLKAQARFVLRGKTLDIHTSENQKGKICNDRQTAMVSGGRPSVNRLHEIERGRHGSPCEEGPNQILWRDNCGDGVSGAADTPMQGKRTPASVTIQERRQIETEFTKRFPHQEVRSMKDFFELKALVLRTAGEMMQCCISLS